MKTYDVDSLEAACQGAYNEYPQYMFLWKKKEKILCHMDTLAYLEL